MTAFVLVHSPLVGPMTWEMVAPVLRDRGHMAVVPSLALALSEGRDGPYWTEHARAVARAIEVTGIDQPLVLVGHSGAGPSMPAIRQAVGGSIEAYVFVDAGLPSGGVSRLDAFEDRAEAEAFRKSALDGFLRVWTEEDLRGAIPDDGMRTAFVAELRPLPLAVYEEPLPVFDGWPDAPCAYLRFIPNPAYDRPARWARAAGWPVVEIAGGHFHMLVDPAGVANALEALTSQASRR